MVPTRPTDRILSVTWCCSHFYGPPRWHGTEYYEPDECGKVFSTEVTLDEWESQCATATCPKCRADLDQTNDCPELDIGVGDVIGELGEDAKCPACGVRVGPLVIFPGHNQWACPGCCHRFGVSDVEPVS